MVSAPLPDVSAGPVSALGSVGGSDKGASASASADFGEVHLDGSAFFGVTQNPVQAEGFAFASFTDALIVAKTANATFTESADGVFENGRGGLELRVLDLTTDQLVIDTYYDILGDSFPDHTITENVFLQAGDTYVVFAAFEALAGTAANFSDTAYESKADMSNTGQLFIDAPPGSFTTLSGHDYSTDAGVSFFLAPPNPRPGRCCCSASRDSPSRAIESREGTRRSPSDHRLSKPRPSAEWPPSLGRSRRGCA